MKFLGKLRTKLNQGDSCLMRLEMTPGTIVASTAIDDFLIAGQTPAAMDAFYATMKERYDIKQLGRPSRYLGLHCHYDNDGEHGPQLKAGHRQDFKRGSYVKLQRETHAIPHRNELSHTR